MGILLGERANTYHGQSPSTRGRVGSSRESRVTGVNSEDPLPVCSRLQNIAPPRSSAPIAGGIKICG